ncbi:hypothetical protein GF314_10260 [bacterium]|nr:hypothetical protein [bacterium]
MLTRPDHLDRTARWLLLGGAMAMALTGLVAGAHASVVHHCDADAAAHGGDVDCPICLHLQHRHAAWALPLRIPQPEPAGVIVASVAAPLRDLPAPTACGRAPPASSTVH